MSNMSAGPGGGKEYGSNELKIQKPTELFPNGEKKTVNRESIFIRSWLTQNLENDAFNSKYWI